MFITIPQYSEEGVWTLNLFSVSDALGNSLKSIYNKMVILLRGNIEIVGLEN